MGKSRELLTKIGRILNSEPANIAGNFLTIHRKAPLKELLGRPVIDGVILGWTFGGFNGLSLQARPDIATAAYLLVPRAIFTLTYIKSLGKQDKTTHYG